MKICSFLEPALEPESLSLHLYLGRDQSALREPSHAHFSSLFWWKTLLQKSAVWSRLANRMTATSTSRSWTRCLLKLHLIKSAHTHADTCAHTQTERTDLALMKSVLITLSLLRAQNECKYKKHQHIETKQVAKTVKFHNLEEGRKKCKLSLRARGRDKGDGEDTEVFWCVS